MSFNKYQLDSITIITLEIAMLRSIAVAITLLTAASQQAGFARSSQQQKDSQASILQVKSETVRVKLLDEFSCEVVPNSDVKVRSDNGIRCITAPCPTNNKEWIGRSDDDGYVAIPTSVLQHSTYITTPAHRGGKDLIRGSEKDADGAWFVELIPNRTMDHWPSSYRLKVVDAENSRPLIDAEVNISNARGESFTGKTNSLGYVFFPARAGIDSWVEVAGYKRTAIQWGWVNYRLKLERQ